jgi:hypothetical protein
MRVEPLLDALFITDEKKTKVRVPFSGERRTGSHHPHATIAAHRINRDSRRQSHALSFRSAPDAVNRCVR